MRRGGDRGRLGRRRRDDRDEHEGEAEEGRDRGRGGEKRETRLRGREGVGETKKGRGRGQEPGVRVWRGGTHPEPGWTRPSTGSDQVKKGVQFSSR